MSRYAIYTYSWVLTNDLGGWSGIQEEHDWIIGNQKKKKKKKNEDNVHLRASLNGQNVWKYLCLTTKDKNGSDAIHNYL